ncbi:MAG: hypothetical protein RLW62_17340 [Gammaproteobacteria bacterium]
MRPCPARYPVLVVLLATALSAGAWDDVGNGCPYTADDVAPRIKALLGPHYASGGDAATLTSSFRELEVLLLDIGHCRAVVQSGERPDAERQAHIGEWHSLNQWLYRLVNFVGLNARGDDSVSWRDEYALFAEVYEFEP